MNRITFTFLISLFVLVACKNNPAPSPPLQSQHNTSEIVADTTVRVDSIKAVMKVESYTIHFATDSRENNKPHEFKSKIMFSGESIKDSSTHTLTKVELWYVDNGNDTIIFDRKTGELKAWFPKNEMQLMIQLLESDYDFRISYSMDTKGLEHILASTYLKEQ